MAQSIKMGNRDSCQPRILRLAIELELAVQNAPRRRSAERRVRLIGGGQQLDIGACLALRKTPPPVDCRH
jgi:hypothetical protein